jgi:hypothetical protein
MNNQLHLSPWKSSTIIVLSLKTSRHTTSCGRRDLCPTSLSSIIKTHLSNIKLQYGVSVSPAYSCLFSRLSSICLSITCQFASKSNCCYKFWVTIQFILFHNIIFLESIDCYVVLTMSIA